VEPLGGLGGTSEVIHFRILVDETTHFYIYNNLIASIFHTYVQEEAPTEGNTITTCRAARPIRRRGRRMLHNCRYFITLMDSAGKPMEPLGVLSAYKRSISV
jgi:hypothetical protein